MPSTWTPSDYTWELGREQAADSEWPVGIFSSVARSTFESPGFCLVTFEFETDSRALRQMMWSIRLAFAHTHHQRTGRYVHVNSVGRFDQQQTTKPHRDGAADESILVLGYEPSPIESEIALLDYSACAAEMGITPAEFLDRHNPMFARSAGLLVPWTTRVESFSNLRPQILVINNSMAQPSDSEARWQGVLHTAAVPHPDETQQRVINSMMLISEDANATDAVTESEVRDFLTTAPVLRRGYATQEPQAS